LYTIKEVLCSNSYVQNILQTDKSTIICMIFGLNKNTIQYNTVQRISYSVNRTCIFRKHKDATCCG